MTPVTLSLPTSLLRRFRELAAEMLPDEQDPFHLALRCAAVEAMQEHASLEPMEPPPFTLVPVLTVYSAVPSAAATFVGLLAHASGLTTEQAWHRVVLEFCERSGPGVPLDVTTEVAA